jgi:hypothetical protein
VDYLSVTLLKVLQSSAYSRWIGNESYKDKDKKAADIFLPGENKVVDRCYLEQVEALSHVIRRIPAPCPISPSLAIK